MRRSIDRSMDGSIDRWVDRSINEKEEEEEEEDLLRPRGVVLGPSWGASRGLLVRLGGLRRSWASLGGLLEASWEPLGASWGSLGGLLEASWGPLGASWAPLGALLGRSWEPWGRSWGHLGGDRSTKGGSLISFAPPERLKSFLGPLLGRSVALLGPSWDPLWPLLGLSWVLSEPS